MCSLKSRDSVVGVILAAGFSRRMGDPKQLLMIQGQRLLERVILAALYSQLKSVVLVLGGYEMSVRKALAGLLNHPKLIVTSNPKPEDGMGSSLSTGISAIKDENTDGVMVLLGDQPFLHTKTIDSVIRCFQGSDKPVCAAFYGSLRGHPIVFDRSLLPYLDRLTGDEGPRQLLKDHPEWIEPVEFDPALGMDLDDPSDLGRLRQRASEAVHECSPSKSAPLSSAFGLDACRRISLVGAGGKTSLMFAMAKELVATGRRVITTTSTKIFLPKPDETPLMVFIEETDGISRDRLERLLDRYGHITLGDRLRPDGKVSGLSRAELARLFDCVGDTHVLVEADGASGKPLKAPRSHEPVIPEGTDLVVGVMGLEVLNRPFTEKRVFSVHEFQFVTGLPFGSLITPDALTRLAVHPQGLFKGAPLRSSRIPFLNKRDLLADETVASDVARNILESGEFLRVVTGSLLPEIDIRILEVQDHA